MVTDVLFRHLITKVVKCVSSIILLGLIMEYQSMAQIFWNFRRGLTNITNVKITNPCWYTAGKPNDTVPN